MMILPMLLAVSWIWPAELGNPTNTVVEFRTRFTAPAAGRAELKIAADTVYYAELHGREIYTGRFPDVPPMRFFDELRTDAVKDGENEFRVRLYVQGVDSFQHLAGAPGFTYTLRGNGFTVEGGKNTEWRIADAWRSAGVPLMTMQLGYSFEYDARTAGKPWKRIGEKDIRWVEPENLRPRAVARPDVLSEIPAALLGCGHLDGQKRQPFSGTGMDAMRLSPVPSREFFQTDNATILPGYLSRGAYVTVDLGREECGFLSMDIDTDEGALIDIGWAEHIQDGMIQTRIGRRCFAGTYHAKKGRQQFLWWIHRIAGRYLQLHIRNAKRFRLERLSLRPVILPVEELPCPKFADPRREAIWRTSVRTLRLCMHEHYEDCPWREQALYGNDGRNQMLCGYYAFGPSLKMPELSLELLARGMDDNGWIELTMPARYEQTIPSFTSCWLLGIDDNLRIRKNRSFVRSMMPYISKHLDRRLSEMKDSLLPNPEGKRYWQFYEWMPELSGGNDVRRPAVDGRYFDAPLNSFFILTLEAGARCAEAVGDRASADRWNAAAKEVRAAMLAKFWNPEAGQVETFLGRKGKGAELVQALALLSGSVPVEARASVVRKLSAPSDWTATSLSQTLYKYEALISAGGESAKAAVESMTALWQKMLDAGATSFWEVEEGWPAFGKAGSLCHGWSAVPVYIYAKYPEL